MYSDAEPLTLIGIMEKASSLFFPGGKNDFAGFLENMTVSVCSATRAEITAFQGGGTLNDYLEENGMYPSTYLYLCTKPKSLSDFIAEVDGWCSDSSDNSSSALTRQNITRIICKVCSCTYEEGGDCLRCEQNKEYEESLRADAAAGSLPFCESYILCLALGPAMLSK